ncbi:ferredoxin [Streptomyces kebangsaanensis]|uniref:Ferredoxin n=1 Tax=Streptomyces kebangsaanensis TaxID=864058 RepID=A0ABW6L2T1_9ACTN
MTCPIAQPCVDVKGRARVEECPVEAVFREEDVPAGWRDRTRANAEFFDGLGSPGGAARPAPAGWRDRTRANAEFFDGLGSPGGAARPAPTARDHPLIAGLPPQERRP